MHGFKSLISVVITTILLSPGTTFACAEEERVYLPIRNLSIQSDNRNMQQYLNARFGEGKWQYNDDKKHLIHLEIKNKNNLVGKIVPISIAVSRRTVEECKCINIIM